MQAHELFERRTVQAATVRNPTGHRGPTLRLHIGLENVDDLKADLARGFAALEAG
jgi:cystathionine beta-lyase/cystathionine gamma-synthase